MQWGWHMPPDESRAGRHFTGLPRAFHRIRLELVREPGFSNGGSRQGYVFVAPLDEAGRIDAKLWKKHHSECCVVRFRPDDEDVGHLVHQPRGAWAFHYDIHGERDDERGYHFGDERFVVGEHVSIEEGDRMRTFKVVSVEPA